MTDITDANDFLAARNLTDWSDLDLAEKVGFLAQAGDYILANYNFIIEAPETHDHYKSAKFWLAYQLSKSPLQVAHSNAIKSTENTLEGLVTEKVSYDVTTSDPYPLITQLLRPITAQVGGFQIVQVTK